MINFDIRWSDPIKHDDINGVYYTREWLIPYNVRQPFFALYKSNKGVMIGKGYHVEKRGDHDWYFVEKRNNIEDFIELPKPKKEILYNQDNTPLNPYKVKDTSGLLPWQIDSVSKIVASIKKWN